VVGGGAKLQPAVPEHPLDASGVNDHGEGRKGCDVHGEKPLVPVPVEEHEVSEVSERGRQRHAGTDKRKRRTECHDKDLCRKK
jgi:hypothetical protein